MNADSASFQSLPRGAGRHPSTVVGEGSAPRNAWSCTLVGVAAGLRPAQVLWVLLSRDWLGSKGVRALRVRPGALMHHGTWGLREPGRPHLGGTLPCCPGGCEFGVQWGGTPDLRAGMSGCVCPGQGRGGENCCLSGFSGC